MKMRNLLAATILFTIILSASNVFAQDNTSTEKNELRPEEKLVVLWTSGDKDVAIKMVYMYTYNAKKYAWWDDITFIIWGASTKLLSEDKDLQEYLGKMKEVGIDLKACKACADLYGVSEKLEELGVIVKYMGVDLTNYIKEGRHILTF